MLRYDAPKQDTNPVSNESVHMLNATHEEGDSM